MFKYTRFFSHRKQPHFPPIQKKQTKKKNAKTYIKTDYATKQTKNADMIFTGVITATYTHNPKRNNKNCKFPLKKTGLSKILAKTPIKKKPTCLNNVSMNLPTVLTYIHTHIYICNIHVT